MSQQALSKARSKFDHTPFKKLFYGIRNTFYDSEYIDNLQRFNGKFLKMLDIFFPERFIELSGLTESASSDASSEQLEICSVMNDVVVRDHGSGRIIYAVEILDDPLLYGSGRAFF